MQVVIKIILYGAPYTVCYLTNECLAFPHEKYYKEIGVNSEDIGEVPEDVNVNKKIGLKYTTNALFLHPLVGYLLGEEYRTKVILNLNKLCGWPACRTVLLRLYLMPPDTEILDYGWNERMLKLIWTRVEIENAFSWLSTLGGAYSALGDYFDHCAEEAGRISLTQYKLSKLLGDEALAARSKLYSALALSQKGRLHTARKLVRSINEFSIKTSDYRLNRMCQGVWAKLKYMRSLKHLQKQGKGDANNSSTINVQ